MDMAPDLTAKPPCVCLSLQEKSMEALLLIGFQIDFLPGGSISVPNAGKAISLTNNCMERFSEVLLCLDWHPADHSSFAANHLWRRPGQTIPIAEKPRLLWDMHCVQDSFGAEIPPALDTHRITYTCYKGTQSSEDSYSAFWNTDHLEPTGLKNHIHTKGIDTLYLAGMPLEYEILHTTLDALEQGLKTIVLEDVVFALDPQNTSDTLDRMKAAGAALCYSTELNLT